MKLLDKINEYGSHFEITEECLYDEIAQEVENNIRKDGLWTKALSESNMNEERAKALYIKLRVDQLNGEAINLISKLKIDEQNKYLELIEFARKDRQLAADELINVQTLKMEINKLQLEYEENNNKSKNEIEESNARIKSDLNYLKNQVKDSEVLIKKQRSEIKELEVRNNQSTTINMILVFCLLASVLFYSYRYTEITEAEQALQKIKNEQIKSNKK